MIHLLFVGGKPGQKKTKTSQENVVARGCFFKDMSVGWGDVCGDFVMVHLLLSGKDLSKMSWKM